MAVRKKPNEQARNEPVVPQNPRDTAYEKEGMMRDAQGMRAVYATANGAAGLDPDAGVSGTNAGSMQVAVPEGMRAVYATANGAGVNPTEARVGTVGKISSEDIARAEEILRKYKDGKANLEKRIIENERWYRLRNWENIGRSQNKGDPDPVSGWLFNSIVNKHADAMDNMPEPNVLPREESDEETAKVLSSVIPAVLEACQFEQVYDKVWWYKLKTGTGVYGVVWDSTKENGLGDIDIREWDILNLFWQPGITDIQKSRNLFHVELIDRDVVKAEWPEVADKLSGTTIDVAKYYYDDTVDTQDKLAVVDWYYKVRRDGKMVLHYCKFCCGQVLYASENDPMYAERGYYDHGKYPVVFDVLFPIAGSPCGFGYVDVCRSPQTYIDRLDQAMMKNALLSARPRYFVRQDGKVNEREYADASKDFVHFSGSGDPKESIFQTQVPQMGAYAMAMRTAKIDELKETSGNRDFQQGGTMGGITAASAIIVLQEAGSKSSRDMIKSSYRAQADICYLCIDLIRQFYTEPRTMRIVGESGQSEYAQISAGMLAAQPQGDDFGVSFRERVPVFDIKVSAQRASPFATTAQNERAKELYGMGFFRPDMADQAMAALEMMQFDGIDKVRRRVESNGTLMQKLSEIGQIALAMAQQLDMLQGTQYTMQIAQLMGMQMQEANGMPVGGGGAEGDVNALGKQLRESRGQTVESARTNAGAQASPR